MITSPPYNPVQGETYSLFGSGGETNGYYANVEALLDTLFFELGDERQLLAMLRKAGSHGPLTRLKKTGSRSGPESFSDHLFSLVESELARYTQPTENHLAGLSFRRRLDRVIGMPRRAYHFGMLEISLVNRMQRDAFLGCDYKLALLPHCLSDFRETCRKERAEIDYICRKCAGDCHIHAVSDVLERHSIEPCIWMEMGRGTLFKTLRRRGRRAGILGIACIPELLAGMRMCMKQNVPVVGIPLNANRCARWMDRAHENSVSLDALRALLAPS